VKQQRQVAVWLAPAAFVAAITALGQISGLKLLFFPELGALASVVFRDPASPWARSPRLPLEHPGVDRRRASAVQRFITATYSLGSMAIKRSRLEGLSASRST
jgi:hypothetical protein